MFECSTPRAAMQVAIQKVRVQRPVHVDAQGKTLGSARPSKRSRVAAVTSAATATTMLALCCLAFLRGPSAPELTPQVRLALDRLLCMRVHSHAMAPAALHPQEGFSEAALEVKALWSAKSFAAAIRAWNSQRGMGGTRHCAALPCSVGPKGPFRCSGRCSVLHQTDLLAQAP